MKTSSVDLSCDQGIKVKCLHAGPVFDNRCSAHPQKDLCSSTIGPCPRLWELK